MFKLPCYILLSRPESLIHNFGPCNPGRAYPGKNCTEGTLVKQYVRAERYIYVSGM